MIGSRKLWLGLGISVLLLGVFLTTSNPGRMLDNLAGANYVYVLPAVGLYLVSVLFRTVRLRLLMRHIRPIGLRRLYRVEVVGYMANNLLPLRLGELVRSYYVSEREGISKTSALATILVERVLDAITLLALHRRNRALRPVIGPGRGLRGLVWGPGSPARPRIQRPVRPGPGGPDCIRLLPRISRIPSRRA